MQGFNMGRYYPPDASNPPRFNTSSHPLGARAKKVNQGILTVRFELPFAVWCNHCKPPAIIGQGVRFNAEKKKVGNYYSTPVWSFRMKHSACGGWWEIRTDPKNAEYVVVEGARRRDYGDGGDKEGGGVEEGDLKMLTEEEREKRRVDAFANLEGRIEEKGMEKKNRERVEELYEQAEVWRDPYDVNARLRKGFRAQRKVLQKEDRYKGRVQDKFSLGIDIADATEEDRIRASLIEFGAAGTSEEKVEQASRKPLFASQDMKTASEPSSRTRKLKSEILAEKSRHDLQQTLVGNTRASIDPFISSDGSSIPKMKLGILKRKRDPDPPPDINSPTADKPTARDFPVTKPVVAQALVGYDSD